MRRLLRILLVLGVLLLLLGVAAHGFLRSRGVADQVASRLEDLFGAPVKVGEVSVGLTGETSLGDVELYEPGPRAPQRPWLKAERLEADVSALKLLAGRTTPREIHLSGAALTLRFGADGRLLTRLPGHHRAGAGGGGGVNPAAFPEVTVEDSRVVLEKEGAPALVLGGIDARLAREDGKLVLTARADNPRWGKWSVRGSFDGAGGPVTAVLQSEGIVHVTQEMLSGLPFVAPSVWEAVRFPQGDTPGRVTLRYDPSARALHYRVELEPARTTVEIPAIDFRAAGAGGKVVLDDEQVALRGVRGRAYGGTLRTDADLDFRGPVTRMRFKEVVARGLNLRDLPPRWELPAEITGRLSGTAALEVAFGHELSPAVPAAAAALAASGGEGPFLAAAAAAPREGTFRVRTRGTGRGEITGATLFGEPVDGAVGLDLYAVPGGFRFGRGPAGVRRENDGAAVEGAGLSRPGEALLVAVLLSNTTVLQEIPPEPGAGLDLPARLANASAALVEQAYRRTLAVGRGLAGMLPRDLKRRPGRPTSYLDVNFRMTKVDLAKFVRGMKLKLPYDIRGRLSFQVKAGIPLNKPRDREAYRVRGSATVTDLAVGGLKLAEVHAEVRYDDGVLRLDALKGVLAAGQPGTFRGTARLPVASLGDLTADVALDRIPLGRVAELAGAGGLVRGEASGRLHAQVPGDRLQEVDAWSARGSLTLPEVEVRGLPLRGLAAEVRLEKGRLSLDDVRAQVAGGPVGGAADVRLAEPFAYHGRVEARALDLAALRRLAPEYRPPVKLEGRVTADADLAGTLRPFTLKASGKAAASDVQAAGLHLKGVRFAWEGDADRLLLKDVSADLYEGTATGSAVLPLAAKAAGSVTLHLKDLNVGELAHDLPGLPLRLEGHAGGDLKGTLPPARPGGRRAANLSLDLKAPQLRVQGVPTEQLRGTLAYKEGAVDYRLEGKSLGGTFELDGRYPTAAPAPKDEAKEGHLRVRRVDLGRLVEALARRRARSPLHGKLDLDVTYRLGAPGALPTGEGKLVLSDVRWHASRLGTLRGDVQLTGEELRLRNLGGTLGEGQVRGQLALNLRNARRGWFTVTLDRVDAGELLAPWLRTPEDVRGPVTARVRATLGETWLGSADVVFERGKVLGVEVSEWRLPVSWEFTPAEGRGRARLEDSSAQVALGRVTGRATVRWGTELNLDGQVRFGGVDLRTLLREAAGSGQFGSGRLSGRFDFAGSSVRSVNDLTGVLDVNLGQTQALEYPVLRQLSPFLAVSPSTSFTRGTLRARLSRGLVRVEHLSLEGGFVRLYAAGTVTLEGGRLNLDVATTTGRVGLDPLRLRILGIRVPLAGPIPLTVLIEANDYLSNRLLQLRVTGTLRNPVVRVLPLATLTNEAIRFFLNRYNLPQL
jgi:hypothetical protein